MRCAVADPRVTAGEVSEAGRDQGSSAGGWHEPDSEAGVDVAPGGAVAVRQLVEPGGRAHVGIAARRVEVGHEGGRREARGRGAGPRIDSDACGGLVGFELQLDGVDAAGREPVGDLREAGVGRVGGLHRAALFPGQQLVATTVDADEDPEVLVPARGVRPEGGGGRQDRCLGGGRGERQSESGRIHLLPARAVGVVDGVKLAAGGAEDVGREVLGERVPELLRPTAEVQVPEPDSSDPVTVHQRVLVGEGAGRVPVELLGAALGGAVPGLPRFGAGRVIGVQVVSDGGGLLVGVVNRVLVAVGRHGRGRDLVGRRRRDAGLPAVVGDAHDHLARRDGVQVLGRDSGLVVVIASQR